MKSLCKIFKKESGYSTILILGILGLGVGSISFVITDVLPKLKTEKSKIESSINYRIFIASLNDYILHAIKERWCLNTFNGNETDLLESSTCTSSPMEDIVTNPGNLERLLWGVDNIGSETTDLDQAKKDNRILPINFVRHKNDNKIRLLKYGEVALSEGKLKLKIPQNSIKDMTDKHPLFTMTNKVKGCLDSVDIEIFQVMDTNNLPGAEERKIGISLNANLLLSLKCLNIRTVRTMSYYTFYPRRLHTFSLIKYGDLEGEAHNQFYGPVYLAGDFILPPEKSNPANNAVFHDTLTFGVFNGGTNNASEFRAGRILYNDKKPYTFEQRGDPYESKQNSYDGFRGFLGGIRLDSSEDKGFYNLFDNKNTNAANLDLLRQCIDKAKFETTPSSNNDSKFGHIGIEKQNSSNNVSLILSFTENNKFKAGVIPVEKNGRVDPFIVDIPKPDNQVVSFGEVFISKKSSSFSGFIGTGSKLEIKTEIPKVQATLNSLKDLDIQDYKDRAKDLEFLDSTLGKEFKNAAESLSKKCNDKVSAESVDLSDDIKKDDVPSEGPTPESPDCNDSVERNSYETAKKKLIQALEKIQSHIENYDTATVTLTIDNITKDTKMVLNQKKLNIEFSPAWKALHEMGKELNFSIEFKAANYSKEPKSIKLDVDGVEVKLKESILTPRPVEILELDCPQGMGQADWDVDMSGSSSFSWNYATTPAGADIQTAEHASLPEIIFDNTFLEGHENSMTKSVVEKCIIMPERTHIYGFYVCKTLEIKPRTTPLHMIGTFIIKDIIQTSSTPIHWYSIWHSVASDLILNDLYKDSPICHSPADRAPLNKMIFKNYLENHGNVQGRMNHCGPQGLIQGKNNFSWTTVDPDVGIAKSGDSMTSQKANRIQKWVIKADSKVEVIK